MFAADAGGELDGAAKKGDGAEDCVRDEEVAVGDELEAVGVVNGLVAKDRDLG